VPSIESVGLNLLRRIEARAATGRLLKARVELHPELADAIQNGRRRDFARLEEEYGVEVEIVASPRLLGPEEQIEWRDRPGGAVLPPLRPAEPVSRRHAAAEPAVVDLVPADETEDEGDEGDEGGVGDGAATDKPAVEAAAVVAEAGRGTRRRRRRGGRRRKRRAGNGSPDAGEPAAEEATGEAAFEPELEAVPHDEAEPEPERDLASAAGEG
jgi:ribonuclease E